MNEENVNRMEDELFLPGRIGRLTAPNRLVAQPMESNCADAGGAVSERCLQKYRELARGGWGVIVVEAVSVTDRSLARRNGLVMNRKNLVGFHRLVDAVKTECPEALLFFQITHSGPESNPAFSERVCASPGAGRCLSADEIARIRDAFVESTLMAEQAGADGVDFKLCHGYLGAELLRPMNVRSDEWGGSWENRTRFLREGVGEVRSRRKRPDFVLGSRISMYEGIRGGCGTASADSLLEDLTEMRRLLELMDASGMDYVNISAGIPARTPSLTRPVRGSELMYLHHLRYTASARETLDGLHSPMRVIGSAYSVLRQKALPLAREMLARGHADFVGWGRQTLSDPLMPRKLQRGEPIDYCIACSGCSQMMVRQMCVGCIVFDEYFKNLWRECK